MIVIHASFPIRSDKLTDTLDLIETLVEQSNREEGIIDYRAATDVQDENIIRIFEQYENEAAFESHIQTDHFAEFESTIADLLAGEPEIHRFEVEDASELEL